MNHHVVIGAGPVGSGIALLLAERGTPVTIITRSASGPDHPHITKLKADANDVEALTVAATGADAIYNCANPPYHQWDTTWPSIHASLMTAAERTGAVLVMMDNLYCFGPGSSMPMNEGETMNAKGTKGAIRARMAKELLEAHASGRLRGTLARASDFYGPGVIDASLGERAWLKILAGKKAQILGAPDQPHSISYMPDVVRTMVTIASDERAWGKAWHVPNAAPSTQRQTVQAFANAAGTSSGVSAVPKPAIKLLGLFNPMMKALQETWYQFSEPWITDSTLTEKTFGLTPTPLAEGAAATAEWWKSRSDA